MNDSGKDIWNFKGNMENIDDYDALDKWRVPDSN